MIDIRTARKQMSLTQGELGDELGLAQSTISRLESGELPLDQRTTLALEALLARKGICIDHVGADIADQLGPSAGNSRANSPCAAPTQGRA